uniref:Uncharacterized protein n=1 Tax=Anguilla anguilla TaxID=7936 RepID=A0A0E9QU02_ANGAN
MACNLVSLSDIIFC